MINIVIPASGMGSRFRDFGFESSKPFILVDGEPMIVRVLENIWDVLPKSKKNVKIMIICKESEFDEFITLKNYSFSGNLYIKKFPGSKITRGSSETVLHSIDGIYNNTPLLIANCDQLINWSGNDFSDTLEMMTTLDYDGVIQTIRTQDPSFSYIRVDETEPYIVTEVKEKEIISNIGTTGLYFWKRGLDFCKYARRMIDLNDRQHNNEFYVAPVYNYAIKDGKKITYSSVTGMHSLGTPEHLEKYYDYLRSK